MSEGIDFFRSLEHALEPIFDHQTYPLIPEDLRTKLYKLKLFKVPSLSEVDCDKCTECPDDNCLSIQYAESEQEYFYRCPTGYLKNPVWLNPDVVKGWQFNFDRLAQLIRTGSKLSYLKNDFTYSKYQGIGDGDFDGKTISVIYGWGLSNDQFAQDLQVISTIVNSKILIVITPSFDAHRTAEAQLLESKQIYFVALKTLLGNEFDVFGLVRDRLVGQKPIEPRFYCYIITNEHPLPRNESRNEKEYQELIENHTKFDLFVDGFTKVVWKKKRKTKLTDGQLSMLREYIEKRQVLAPFQTGEYASEYRRLEVEEAQAKQGLQELSQTGSLESEKGIKLDEEMRRVQNLLKGREKSALEMFKKARAKIDIKQRGKYCCFQRIQSRGRERYATYQFNPPDNLTYCLIIPVV